MTEESMIVAQTIRQQIGTQALMCAGAHKFMALNEAEGSAIPSRLGGLQFDVQGSVFKGRVLVELRPDDTYCVSFWKPIRKAGVYGCERIKVIGDDKGLSGGLYAEDLTGTINREVEGYTGSR